MEIKETSKESRCFALPSNDLLDCPLRIKTLLAARKEIHNLREWIRQEGEHSDVCTFNILREICKGCRCGKAI